MKKMPMVLLLLCLGQVINAQVIPVNTHTKIYLVRHAEKETGPQAGNDPLLTAAGKRRAGDLMRVMSNKNVSRIYVTQYRRTHMTADSMRIQLHIDTVHYTADQTGQSVIEKMLARHDVKKTVLIVGHSNTITFYIRRFGVVNFTLQDIPDKEFDNLYLVRFRKKFLQAGYRAYLTQMKYGVPSPH